MSSHDLHYLSIADAARLIQSGKLSPVELAQALLARIGQLDHRVQAFITLTADRVLAAAHKAEQEIQRGQYRGPLHGVPFGLKDIYDTAGILTSGGSAVCADNVPAQDSTVTRKLLEAGGILLGKLQTHEFAHGGPSFDLPWPPSRERMLNLSNEP